MRVIICDMCGNEITDPRKIRMVHCSRTFNPHYKPKEWKDEYDIVECDSDEKPPKPPRECVWRKEICTDCALKVFDFMEAANSADESADTEADAESPD